MEYRNYDDKHYALMTAVQFKLKPFRADTSKREFPKLSARELTILSRNIGNYPDVVYKEKLYENDLLFAAHPSSFDEETLYKCFSANLAKNKKSFIMAIKTQNISEEFIKKMLIIAENIDFDLYYDILHIASGYVKLSEEFIKEYILEDDEVSESTLINVLQLQTLSEKFIDEYLIDFLDCYRVWEGNGNQECYGWKFLFGNGNVSISEEFFIKHNLMRLNLASNIFFVGYNMFGNEYSHIDLSGIKFNYLYKIFTKACKDVESFIEEELDGHLNSSIYTSFESFGYDFIKKTIKSKIQTKSFHNNLKSLYLQHEYYMDQFLSDIFSSFLLEDEDILFIEKNFSYINEIIYSHYNDSAYEKGSGLVYALSCWWKCTVSQKISPDLLREIICYSETYYEDSDKSYFEFADFSTNKYMTDEHIKVLINANMFNLHSWLYDYKFKFNTAMFKNLCPADYGLLEFGSTDLVNFCNLIFESSSITTSEKIRIFSNIMQYHTPLTDENYEYFVSYIMEIIEGDKGNQDVGRLVGLLVASADISIDHVKSVLKHFDIK